MLIIGAGLSGIGDGDMTSEDAAKLNDLLEKSIVNLSPATLGEAARDMAAACSMFD